MNSSNNTKNVRGAHLVARAWAQKRASETASDYYSETRAEKLGVAGYAESAEMQLVTEESESN